jgi:hypothetical protein
MVSTLRRLTAAVTGIAAFAVTLTVAWAAASPQQTTLQSFVGTWKCVTHGSDNKSFNETDTDTMFGDWLKIESSYAAQAGQPAASGVSYAGYDAKRHHWIVTGVGTDNSYFTAISSSPTWDGAKWTDAYPADHGTAVTHGPSGGKYTLVSSGPGPTGKMMTYTSVCTKQ